MSYAVYLKRSAEKELDYRILYVIDDKDNKIEIISVAHRKEVYR